MDLLKEPFTPEPWDSESHPGKVVADGAGCWWMSAPRAFGNYRLVGMPKALHGMEQDWNPWWEWCFRGELALMAAVRVWDPLVEDEPLGWHKRAGDTRRAQMRHQNLEYNHFRCIHGSYLVHGKCAVDQYCKEFRERSGR